MIILSQDHPQPRLSQPRLSSANIILRYFVSNSFTDNCLLSTLTTPIGNVSWALCIKSTKKSWRAHTPHAMQCQDFESVGYSLTSQSISVTYFSGNSKWLELGRVQPEKRSRMFNLWPQHQRYLSFLVVLLPQKYLYFLVVPSLPYLYFFYSIFTTGLRIQQTGAHVGL